MWGHEKWEDGQKQTLEAEELSKDHQPKRQKPRNSGGFLLHSSAPPQAPEIAASNASNRDVIKGKHKAEDGDLIVPKRALGHRQPKTVRGSPLASEVTTAQDGVDTEASLLDNRHSMHTHASEKLSSSGSRSSAGPERSSHQRSALGHDTNSAEIVNLALSLSERRRRNVSGASMLVPREAAGDKRRISTAQQTLGIPYGVSGGSLRQHLREQRHGSRNISPRSSGSTGRKGETSSPRPQKRNSRQSSRQLAFETGVDDGLAFRASDATFARAEKARATLELGYEYRRLLQYLPALPKGLPNTGKGAERGFVQDVPALGRAYNPLQYVRNRKVRFRDKKPLKSELDGWKDVDRVRAWVDSVKDEREIGISRVDDRFPLPPFDAGADQHTVVDIAGSDTVSQSKSLAITHPTRPRIDWEFTPSDLLADAYWMGQDRNFERIEDRSWQKIIRSPGSYKGEPPNASETSPTSPIHRQSVKLTNQVTSQEYLKELNGKVQDESHERRRQRKGHHKAKSSTDLEDGSRPRRSRWPRNLLRSRSSSSGSQSDWSNGSRHRRGKIGRNNIDNAALEKHMLEMLAQEAEESKSPSKSMEGEVQKSDVANHDLDSNKEQEEAKVHAQDPDRRKKDMPSVKSTLPSARQSLDTERQHRRISSEELRTAPTSPVVPGLAPSIAVDVSPPEGPPNTNSNTTLSPLKMPFASGLGSFRRDRSRSLGIGSASENDASRDQDSSAMVSRQVSNDPQPRNGMIKQRSTEPLHSLLAPHNNNSSGMRARIPDLRSIRIQKELSNPDSKIRGFFRGGRIAELVGNEVSKVGDIFWRKDGSNNPSQLASPAASNPDSDASDEEDRSALGDESGPSGELSRISTNADSSTTQTSKTNSERQRYYMGNLPTFRSTFASVDQSSTTAAPLHSEDHIARQQRMMKERGRSFKFDRLAPPKIDMRSVSPSPSPGTSRSQSRNPARDRSRDSSGTRSTQGVRDADKKLNDMLGLPGRVGSGNIAPTGLAAFSSQARGQRARRRPGMKGEWSISDRGISAVRGNITKRDIARVRALLLSSGIKAGEIFRRNDEPPAQPSILLQGLQDVVNDPIPLLPPSQEVVFAARALIADIEGTNKQLRDAAETFSQGTVEQLHNEIKAVEQRVNTRLTPLVRTAADDADALSAELTTTRTLAVRQLNDSLDSILRSRRRRFRWIRRFGWAMLEWTVLGAMWMVWLIVVIVLILRGTVSGVVRAVRWLLFL